MTNRRTFLKQVTFLASAMLLSFGRAARALGPAGRRVPLLQTATTETSTQIIVLRTLSENWHYEVVDSQDRAIGFTSAGTVSGPNSKYATERLTITGINARDRFRLKIFAGGRLLDTRTFKGLELSRDNARFAILSCMDDRAENHAEMWREVISEQPDVMFFLGDNVYVDGEDQPVTAELIWARYVETRLTLDVYQMEPLAPVFATWDDHDYGEDNAGASFRFKQEAYRTFKAFYGGEDAGAFKNGPGVSSLLNGFGQRFVLLDSRSFRSRGEQWGAAQKSWLYGNLDPRSTAPVWVFNGSQFYGAYQQYESVEREAPRDLNELTSNLSALAAPVVLAAGDVHYSEIMNLEPAILGYPTVEITSSALHSVRADGLSPNRRRAFATLNNSFVMAETRVRGGVLDLSLRIRGAQGATYFNSSHSIANKGKKR